MNIVSRIEEILLLAIWKLEDNAYGISIREQVEQDTGNQWSSGAIYAPLNRLKKNGYVETFQLEDTSPKSGRPRIYYRLTSLGKKKLISVQEVSKTVWLGVPDLRKEFKT